MASINCPFKLRGMVCGKKHELVDLDKDKRVKKYRCYPDEPLSNYRVYHFFYASKVECDRCLEDFVTCAPFDFNQNSECSPCREVSKLIHIDKYDGKTPGMSNLEDLLKKEFLKINDRMEKLENRLDKIVNELLPYE